MKKLLLFFTLIPALFVFATPTTVTDTDPGLATVDGTIGGGEYPGSYSGINSGFGDVIGTGSLFHIDSDLSGNLVLGLDSAAGIGANDSFVIYIDSVSGGFTNLNSFTDTIDDGRKAISGTTNGTDHSNIEFAPGFEADYAISFDAGFVGLFELQGGAAHNFVTGSGPTTSGTSYEWGGMTLADIGLSAGDSFNFVGTLLNVKTDSAFRSDEFLGVDSSTVAPGNIGAAPNTVTLAAGDFNTFVSIPEPATLGLMGLGLLAVARRYRKRD